MKSIILNFTYNGMLLIKTMFAKYKQLISILNLNKLRGGTIINELSK